MVLEKMTASRGVGLGSARLAYVHLALGEEDKALSLLERAVADRDSDVLWIRVDPSVDRLRGLPRFEELSRRVGTSP